MEEESSDMESDSSSLPTTEEDDDEENALETRAAKLEDELKQNVYLYDVHIELVRLYQKLGDLNSMRGAYERFHKYFPLTPALWLSWIQDEIKTAQSSADKKKILSLFETAVVDYQSVKLWQEYAQFAIGSCGVEEVRSILEDGLNSVGLHVAEGSLLWDTFREFEMAYLSVAEPKSEQFQAQLHRVVEVFRRQLSVPLLDMETTYEEWKTFLKELPEGHGVDEEPIDWGYKKALKSLEVYKPFEMRLVESDDDTDLNATYKEYIRKLEDPSLILCVYERAVAQLCLNSILWEDYCYYALKFGDVVLQINNRSLRNCPWSVQLWVTRLRLLEHLDRPKAEVLECFEQALSAVSAPQALDLWLSYIEYVKRTAQDPELLGQIFKQAKQLGPENDPSCKILRLEARFAVAKPDMPLFRKIWSEIVRHPPGRTSGIVWMEYATLERQYGDAKHVRNVFQKAISNCKDWQQFFADEWLSFEREAGTLQDVMSCVAKCRNYSSEPTEAGNWNHTNPPSGGGTKRIADDGEAGRTQHKKQKTFDRRDAIAVKMDTTSMGPPENMDPTKSVFVSNLNSKVDEDKLKELFANSVHITIPKRKGFSRCFAYVQFANDDEAREALKRDREPLDGRPIFISECKPDRAQRQTVFKYSDKMEYNKLFVRGLPKEYTKADVEAVFKPYGATDVRLVLKFNGQFKGLAYVDFANDADAERALKSTNELKLGEHTINVAISAPPSKKNDGVIVAAARTTGRNSKSRLEIPFVPRSVLVKRNVDEAEMKPIVGKTNEDFRKLLIK